MSNPGDTPRVDQIESSLPVKYQTKNFNPGGVLSVGALSGSDFNNLTIGKTYRYILRAMVETNSNSLNTSIFLKAVDGVSDLSIQERFLWTAASASGGGGCPLVIEIIFEAATTTVYTEIPAVVNGFCGAAETILEELPNHSVTTDWT